MDILANDLADLISLLAAILSVVAGVLPFLKKSNDMMERRFLKKPELQPKVVIKKSLRILGSY